MRRLMQRDNVDINVKDLNGEMPLILAARGGYEAVVWQLLQRSDTDINAKNKQG